MVGALLAVSVGVFGAISKPAQAEIVGGRLITVHDRGSETAFITTKDTLKDALAEQNIQLTSEDAVEPAVDEKLVAPDYQVNIYRARPITVVDGAVRQKIVTPYQTAERIAKDAGITLYKEDTTTLEQSSDIMSGGAGLQLVIHRATPMVLNFFGKEMAIRTQAKTVGEMLKEKEISLGEDDRASVPLETPITEGMEVRVWREGTQTITVDEAISFETEQVKDADREVGYKEVQTTGQNGKRTVTYQIEIQNGVEVSRTEIATITIEEAVKQVEIIGSKAKTLPYTGGGTKTDWLADSDIDESYWGIADFLVAKESGWNPNSVNKSSGACGLPQALPCSKLGSNWNDPVHALNWMNSYVNGRYGGWEGAYNWWLSRGWY